MSGHDDDRLVDGRRIGDVLDADERQREREEAEREAEQEDAYMGRFFPQTVQGESKPTPKPDPKKDGNPDLHAGPRQGAPAEDVELERYMSRFPGAA
jgi:hypothetical protein